MNKKTSVEYAEYLKKIENFVRVNGNVFDKSPDEIRLSLKQFKDASEDFFNTIKNEDK